MYKILYVKITLYFSKSRYIQRNFFIDIPIMSKFLLLALVLNNISQY